MPNHALFGDFFGGSLNPLKLRVVTETPKRHIMGVTMRHLSHKRLKFVYLGVRAGCETEKKV